MTAWHVMCAIKLTQLHAGYMLCHAALHKCVISRRRSGLASISLGVETFMLAVAPHRFASPCMCHLLSGSEACQLVPDSIQTGHYDQWLVSGSHSSSGNISGNTPCSTHLSAASLSPLLTDGDPLPSVLLPLSSTPLPSGHL